MSPRAERRLLQAATALACLVPLSMGAAGVLGGAAVLKGVGWPPPVDLDSHFRYLSGLFLAIGVAFASCVPEVERKGPRLRLLGLFVVAGGLARLGSLAALGPPSAGHRFGLVMELGVVPLILLWQARVARRAAVGRA